MEGRNFTVCLPQHSESFNDIQRDAVNLLPRLNGMRGVANRSEHLPACTFDLEQMRAVEEPGCSPYVVDISCSTDAPQYESETIQKTSARSIDSGYISHLQFPYHFDSNADGFYHVPSSATCATSVTDNLWKSDVYRDILDCLENFYYYGPSTESHRDDTVSTLRLQTPCDSCSVNNTAPNSDNYSSHQQKRGRLQPSPHHTSSFVFDKNEEPMTLFQTLECLDFSEEQALPLQTESTWCSNYSSTTKSVSEQTYLSEVPRQLTSLAAFSKSQPESDHQQPNGIDQPQTLYVSREDHAALRTDSSKDFISTSSLKTTNALPQSHFVVTPDQSGVTHISTSSEHPTSLAVSRSHHVFSSGNVAESQIACRRQLFGDASRCQNDYDYRVRQKLQQEQDWFRQRRPQTSSCAVLENEHRTDKPFPAPSQLDFSKDSASTIPEISTCRERRSYVMSKVRPNNGECSPLKNCSPHPLSSAGEIANTQARRRHRLFDDVPGCYDADEGGYVVRKNSQQQYDSFHNSSPRTSRVVAYNEDSAIKPSRVPDCVDFSDSCPAFSPEKAATSCRRRLFDDTGYRVRKKSASVAAAHRCHICDRAYTRPSTLRDHVRARHSTEPKPHVCSICDRRFTQLSNLDAHRRTHTGLFTKLL